MLSRTISTQSARLFFALLATAAVMSVSLHQLSASAREAASLPQSGAFSPVIATLK